MCDGCLEDACIHVRERSSSVDHSKAKCLFGKIHGLDSTCPINNPPPPKEFPYAEPKMLDLAIWNFNNDRDDLTKQPPEPDWPLLIPEVSDITHTTARLQVYPDEGDWKNPHFDSIAWDMTGYLLDKLQGAPWVREPNSQEEEDWHFIIGSRGKSNSVQNVLLIDRLPDRLAIQTPPTSIMVAYLNRLRAHNWKLFNGDDSPRPWLLTNGYPSYIDWPPAWHWNLGIRMLSSLVEYLSSQAMGFMGPEPGAWYPDRSRKTTTDLRLPFVQTSDGDTLLWTPKSKSWGSTEMDWDYFPGIIPFVPGATTTQLKWFAEKIVKMGFKNVAIDAVNSIAHENFKGIPEAVSILKSAGVRHVMIYGPWPLHIPKEYAPRKGVSYIPTASHMDMTNSPSRYWIERTDPSSKKKRNWQNLPSYKMTSLVKASSIDNITICECEACQSAKVNEISPQSIWRWSHMLLAGNKWMKYPSKDQDIVLAGNKRLWYQGPSYTVFRKCLHYPPESKEMVNEELIDSIVFDDTSLAVVLTDGTKRSAELIRWTWSDEMHEWSNGFPKLE